MLNFLRALIYGEIVLALFVVSFEIVNLQRIIVAVERVRLFVQLSKEVKGPSKLGPFEEGQELGEI